MGLWWSDDSVANWSIYGISTSHIIYCWSLLEPFRCRDWHMLPRPVGPSVKYVTLQEGGGGGSRNCDSL